MNSTIIEALAALVSSSPVVEYLEDTDTDFDGVVGYCLYCERLFGGPWDVYDLTVHSEHCVWAEGLRVVRAYGAERRLRETLGELRDGMKNEERECNDRVGTD